jgi:agmatine deiminase
MKRIQSSSISIITMSASRVGGSTIQHSFRRRRRRWPAEWEPHEWTILIAPHNRNTFALDRAMPQFLSIVETLCTMGQERVWILVNDDLIEQQIKTSLSLSKPDSVTTVIYRSNDSWARDTSPTFAIEKEEEEEEEMLLVGLDWEFNAYGGETDGCYWPCDADRELAGFVCRTLPQVQHERIPKQLILEGGAIHTDGQGTILTTRECIRNPNRNPHLSQQQIEESLLFATGCTKIIWLEYGLAFDNDTNGHIDNFACFVQPTHIVLAWTDDEQTDTENYHRCRDAYHRLVQATDAKGNSLHIHKLYLPRPQYYTERDIRALASTDNVKAPQATTTTTAVPRTVGERMAASYVNFYIANAAVLVPQFGDEERDRLAIQTLEPFFLPNRTVVGIPSRDILVGGGNIHCITQQVPRIQSNR